MPVEPVKKGIAIREKGKKYEPSKIAKGSAFGELLEIITSKQKATIQSEFSRKGKKTSNSNDVASYIDEYYKKDVRKNPNKYF